MHDDFVANLRLLCSYYPSIAEVCRRLTINRAQFNRYLSGRYRPSHAALQRICHFSASPLRISRYPIMIFVLWYKPASSIEKQPQQRCLGLTRWFSAAAKAWSAILAVTLSFITQCRDRGS